VWIPYDESRVTSLDGSLIGLALVLSHASLYERIERKQAWKPGYLLPCFMMDVAKCAGFAGVRYSSVRAAEGENLVLFDSDVPTVCVGVIERREYKPDTRPLNDDPI
jgi:hypothetical protein